MKSVLCIVVTYNRLECLKECLSALSRQSCNDFDILVVNNGSTDGTKEFLESQEGLLTIHQTNLGGAGGFYAGMRYGFDNDYQWVWLMDDDGIPAPTQLEELLKYQDKSWYLNALVICKDDHSQFAFPPLDASVTIASVKKNTLIEGFCHPFNGTLYKKDLIERIGFIKKEMFIWGDEKEYTARAIKAGIVPVTVTSAIHYHPKEKATKVYALPLWHHPKTEVLLKPVKMSRYYYRNLGYIDATYRTKLKSFKLILMHTFYFARTLKLSELRKFYRYYFAGRKNNYNG